MMIMIILMMNVLVKMMTQLRNIHCDDDDEDESEIKVFLGFPHWRIAWLPAEEDNPKRGLSVIR